VVFVVEENKRQRKWNFKWGGRQAGQGSCSSDVM
jgi:hypothetical protein